MDARYLSLTKASEVYGPCRAYWYKLLSRKSITAVKLGKKTLLDRESIDAYFQTLPAAQIKAEK